MANTYSFFNNATTNGTALWPTLNPSNMLVGVKAKCSANSGVATLFVDAMKIMY